MGLEWYDKFSKTLNNSWNILFFKRLEIKIKTFRTFKSSVNDLRNILNFHRLWMTIETIRTFKSSEWLLKYTVFRKRRTVHLFWFIKNTEWWLKYFKNVEKFYLIFSFSRNFSGFSNDSSLNSNKLFFILL